MGVKQFGKAVVTGVAKKALVGGITGLVGALTTALADGSLTVQEIVVAVLTGLVAALGVYQTTNETPVE